MHNVYCHKLNLPDTALSNIKQRSKEESSDSVQSSSSSSEGSVTSLGSKSEFQNDFDTRISIIRQPQRYYRFRYESERWSEILLADGDVKAGKSLPTVAITPPLVKHAVVLATCVASKEPHRLLPFQLHGKYCKNGIFFKKIRPGSTSLKLKDIRIVRVQREHYKSCMNFKEKFAKFDPFNHGYWRAGDSPGTFDTNTMRIAIQMFLKDEASGKYRLRVAPILTHTIYGRRYFQPKLTIEQLSQSCAYADGKLLCNRSKLVVMYRQKGDFPPDTEIRVRFFETDKTPKTIWRTYAKIIDRAGTSIWCEPPEYFDLKIRESREVRLQLVASNNEIVSNPVPFMIIPIHSERLLQKRLIKGVTELVAKNTNVSISTRPDSQQQKRLRHLFSTDPEALTREIKKFRPNIRDPINLPLVTSSDHEEVNIFPPACQKIMPKPAVPTSSYPRASKDHQKILVKPVPTDPIAELEEFLRFPGPSTPDPSEENTPAAFIHSQKTMPERSGTVICPQPASSTTFQDNLAIPVKVLSVLNYNIPPSAIELSPTDTVMSTKCSEIKDFQGNFWIPASEKKKLFKKDIPEGSAVNLDAIQKTLVENRYQKPRDKENVKFHQTDSAGPSRLKEAQLSQSRTSTRERKVINTYENSMFPNGAGAEKITFPEITRLLQDPPPLKLYKNTVLRPFRLGDSRVNQPRTFNYGRKVINTHENSVIPNDAGAERPTFPEIARLLQDPPLSKLYKNTVLKPSRLEDSKVSQSKTTSSEDKITNINEASVFADPSCTLTSLEISRLLGDNANLKLHDSPGLGPSRLEKSQVSQSKTASSGKNLINIHENTDLTPRLTPAEIMTLLGENPNLKLDDSPGIGPSMLEESQVDQSKTASSERNLIDIHEDSVFPDLTPKLTSAEIMTLLGENPNLKLHDSPGFGLSMFEESQCSQSQTAGSDGNVMNIDGNSVLPDLADELNPFEIERLLQDDDHPELYNGPALEHSELRESQVSQSKAATFEKDSINILNTLGQLIHEYDLKF